MTGQHRRPRTRLGRLLTAWWIWPAAVGFLLGFAVYYSVPARADGQIDRAEADYINSYGYAVCAVIDEFPNVNGVLGVARGIMADGFAANSAIDIINESVYEDCPRHWPLLVAIGDAARAANGATA